MAPTTRSKGKRVTKADDGKEKNKALAGNMANLQARAIADSGLAQMLNAQINQAPPQNTQKSKQKMAQLDEQSTKDHTMSVDTAGNGKEDNNVLTRSFKNLQEIIAADPVMSQKWNEQVNEAPAQNTQKSKQNHDMSVNTVKKEPGTASGVLSSPSAASERPLDTRLSRMSESTPSTGITPASKSTQTPSPLTDTRSASSSSSLFVSPRSPVKHLSPPVISVHGDGGDGSDDIDPDDVVVPARSSEVPPESSAECYAKVGYGLYAIVKHGPRGCHKLVKGNAAKPYINAETPNVRDMSLAKVKGLFKKEIVALQGVVYNDGGNESNFDPLMPSTEVGKRGAWMRAKCKWNIDGNFHIGWEPRQVVRDWYPGGKHRGEFKQEDLTYKGRVVVEEGVDMCAADQALIVCDIRRRKRLDDFLQNPEAWNGRTEGSPTPDPRTDEIQS